MAEIAVVVGNYEGAHLLPDCLASLGRQTLPPAEVIVVDAGSGDGSTDVARAHGARVLEAENRGLGYLYNLGARAVTTDYVLVANNDLAFDERCLEELGRALDADPRRFAADPRQLDWEGARVIHARTALRRGPLLRTPVPGLVVDPLVPADQVVPTLTANAGAMLLRRSMLLDLGGFDEAFFIDYEDLDLCWRARLRGWESAYVPAAFVRHKVGMSASPAVSPRRLAGSHANVLRFALKCLPPGPAARVALGELLRLPRHPRPVGAALYLTARGLPGILRERRRIGPSRALYERLVGGPA